MQACDDAGVASYIRFTSTDPAVDRAVDDIEVTVAEQFRIDEMAGGFEEWVERNALQMYLTAHGTVLPLRPGHLDVRARVVPQTMDDVKALLNNACRAIQLRTEALASL